MSYTIGQFSKITNISEYTLRYYESENLITPKRLDNGRRCYSENDINWVQFIKRLKDTGMPIKDIKKYAHLRAIGDSTMKERMDLLIQHRYNLNKKIYELSQYYEKLNKKINYYEDAITNQQNIDAYADNYEKS